MAATPTTALSSWSGLLLLSRWRRTFWLLGGNGLGIARGRGGLAGGFIVASVPTRPN